MQYKSKYIWKLCISTFKHAENLNIEFEKKYAFMNSHCRIEKTLKKIHHLIWSPCIVFHNMYSKNKTVINAGVFIKS